MSSWVYLVLAILLEVCGTSCMKASQGLTRATPAVTMFLCYGASLCSLTMALKGIDMSVAYAVWSGVGVVLITLVGWYCFDESLLASKLLCVGLILAGVVGLNLLGGAH